MEVQIWINVDDEENILEILIESNFVHPCKKNDYGMTSSDFKVAYLLTLNPYHCNLFGFIAVIHSAHQSFKITIQTNCTKQYCQNECMHKKRE